MKKFFCGFFAVILFLSGCSNSDAYTYDSTSQVASASSSVILTESSHSTTTKGGTVKTNMSFPKFSNDIIIHQIYREAFYAFLEQPDYTTIYNGSHLSNHYPQNGEGYVNWSSVRLAIGDNLVSFASQKEAIRAYLLEQGKTVDVQGAVLIDAPYVPLTILVKTAEQPMFITVDEEKQWNSSEHTYTFYTYTEYRDKFRKREGKLLVKGANVTEKGRVKLYYRYADLPFVGVMKALGATVEIVGEKVLTISYQNKKYTLDMSEKTLTSNEGNGGNLLLVNGGPMFIYEEDGDLMVDDGVLSSVLYRMGANCKITLNMDSETVFID